MDWLFLLIWAEVFLSGAAASTTRVTNSSPIASCGLAPLAGPRVPREQMAGCHAS